MALFEVYLDAIEKGKRMDIPDDVRARLEERGIDIERSVEEFIAEVKQKPPPMLLWALEHPGQDGPQTGRAKLNNDRRAA